MAWAITLLAFFVLVLVHVYAFSRVHSKSARFGARRCLHNDDQALNRLSKKDEVHEATPLSSQVVNSRTALFGAEFDTETVSRRDLIVQAEAFLLSSLLLGSTSALPASAQDKAKTIVVTGSNSGVGFEGCKRLAAQGHTLVLACRTEDKARDAADRIQATTTAGKLIPAECDLADLASVKSFADKLPGLIGNTDAKIDTLCLNAGLARNTAATDCARTKDGFELTGETIEKHLVSFTL